MATSIMFLSSSNLMPIFSLPVFVLFYVIRSMRKRGHFLSIWFCLQSASDFDFVSIRLFLVAAIFMICLVETLGGTFSGAFSSSVLGCLGRSGNLLLLISL